MRILIASQSYDLHSNGQAVFSVHLAEGLVRRGFKVLVLKPVGSHASYAKNQNGVQIGGIRSLSLDPLFPDVLVSLFPDRQVVGYLEAFAPDLVHIQDHYPLCRSVLRQSRRRSLPVVGTNHFLPQNMTPYVPLLSASRRGRRLLDRVIWRMVLDVFEQVRVVTAPSHTAARILRQQGLTVPVQAISCGVDLERFKPNPRLICATVRQEFHLSPLSRIFLYVGRLDLEKRVDVLIRAWSLLSRPDIQLAIAGTGNQEQHLKKLVKELGLEKRVVFLGFVPGPELPMLLNSVDYFAMPSDVELQSIATLEALASGCPVLAANARALPELVEEGVNGCLFNPNDPQDAVHCIERLVNHPVKWKAMSAASLRKAHAHRFSKTLDQYIALYREVYSVACSGNRVSHQDHHNQGLGEPL